MGDIISKSYNTNVMDQNEIFIFHEVLEVTLLGHLVNLKQYRDDQQFPCIRMNRFTKRFIRFFLHLFRLHI